MRETAVGESWQRPCYGGRKYGRRSYVARDIEIVFMAKEEVGQTAQSEFAGF